MPDDSDFAKSVPDQLAGNDYKILFKKWLQTQI
jgi:hypothetical protein